MQCVYRTQHGQTRVRKRGHAEPGQAGDGDDFGGVEYRKAVGQLLEQDSQ